MTESRPELTLLNEALEKELLQSPCFKELNQEQFQCIRCSLGVVRLKEGDHLFEYGQKAERFYYLHRGQIKLYRLSPAGNEKVFEIISPGHTFAEAVMFMAQQTFPVNAQALCETEVIAIENRAFLNVLRDSVDTCFRLMSDMSIRLRTRLNEIEALTLQNGTLRLVNYLLFQVADHGGADQICLPAPKHVIASHLSIQPETLSRLLSHLASEGLISVKGLMITIRDINGLRALAH